MSRTEQSTLMGFAGKDIKKLRLKSLRRHIGLVIKGAFVQVIQQATKELMCILLLSWSKI